MENASWFKRRGIVIYIFRHRNLGWICIPLLAWQAQIGALGIAIIIIVGWMATQSVKHSSAPVGGREGADIAEGRLRGEEGVSLAAIGEAL